MVYAVFVCIWYLNYINGLVNILPSTFYGPFKFFHYNIINVHFKNSLVILLYVYGIFKISIRLL